MCFSTALTGLQDWTLPCSSLASCRPPSPARQLGCKGLLGEAAPLACSPLAGRAPRRRACGPSSASSSSSFPFFASLLVSVSCVSLVPASSSCFPPLSEQLSTGASPHRCAAPPLCWGCVPPPVVRACQRAWQCLASRCAFVCSVCGLGCPLLSARPPSCGQNTSSPVMVDLSVDPRVQWARFI